MSDTRAALQQITRNSRGLGEWKGVESSDCATSCSANSISQAFHDYLSTLSDGQALYQICSDEVGCDIMSGPVLKKTTDDCGKCVYEFFEGCLNYKNSIVRYRPGDKLPEFSGYAEVCLTDGTTAKLHGCEVIPESVAGYLDFNGKDEDGKVIPPVFIPGKNLPDVIIASIPELIRIGGDKPDPDGTVQLHIDAEGHQLYNNGDTFVSVTPTK